MASVPEIRNTDPGEDFHRCPNCGYGRGFHCSFLRAPGNPDRYRVVLICPECGTRFEIGWSTGLEKGVEAGP